MTMRKPLALVFGASLGVALWGSCASRVDRVAGTEPKSRATPTLVVGSSTVLKHPRHEVVTELDLNQDGRTDLWSYRSITRGAQGQRRELLLRKELDINGDGKVDVIRLYEGLQPGEEQLAREGVDLDFDGRIDQLNHYRQELVHLRERDTDGDGRADEWRHLLDGKLVSRERDTDGDGIPDLDLPTSPEEATLSPSR
jgi:hypothetical protein